MCADLKVVALLQGLQLGLTKYCCLLYLWDSRARNKHYIEKTWAQGIGEEEGQHNVVALPLVSQNKIIFSPLLIKLGLFKGKIPLYLKFCMNAFPNCLTPKQKKVCFLGLVYENLS